MRRSSRTSASSGVAHTIGVTDAASPTISAIRVAGLGRGEVGAHPRAQVVGLADVEHLAALVDEQVDAGQVRQGLGEVALAALRGGDPRGEGAQLVERVHAQVAEPLDQPVQHVDGGPRVGQRAVVGRRRGPEEPGQAWRACSWASRRGSAPDGRAARCRAPTGRATRDRAVEQAALRKPTSNGALWATSTVSRANSRNDGSTGLEPRRAGHHGVGDAGQHRDERRDRHARG